MRILAVGSLYPPYHLGGYELVWQAAVGALRAKGHDVRVVAVDDRLGRAPAADEEPGVHRELRWYWRDHEFPRRSWRERLALERHNHAVLRRHLADHGPHVVSWWSMGGLSLSLIESVRRAGVPAVGWVNDGWLIYGPQVDPWLEGWRGRLRPRRLGRVLTGVPTAVDLGAAARWVFCSEAMRRPALERVPRLRATAVLHQGVAPVFKAAEPAPWRGRLLYAGRVDERKGLLTLVDAVLGLPEVTLRIVGVGDEATTRRLRERAAPAGDRIAIEPAVERPALVQVYADSDAVVFPVEWPEPWGLVPLEAMAVGRPVVATGRGGSAEYLRHESNALLFEAGDADALRAALRRLGADPALRAMLRAGGLKTAGRLTEEAWTRNVVREHEELAGPRPAAR